MRWPSWHVPDTIAIAIRDLTLADLEHLRWSGGRSQLLATGLGYRATTTAAPDVC